MWSSIEQIIKPDNFHEALALIREPGISFFAGGSHLLAHKDRRIHTLIDINHLLDNVTKEEQGGLLIGAGCTLQELLPSCSAPLKSVILASCPSKNIRNQRTLGGEIAMGSPDSDLLVFLHAAEAQLRINETEQRSALATWNRKGIISSIFIPKNHVTIERVAVIDSAPAFIIVALQQTPEYLSLAIGGKASNILFFKTQPLSGENQTREILDKVETIFFDDHYGSPAYKRQVISNLVSEMTVTA